VRAQRREHRLRRSELVFVVVLILYGVIFGDLIWCLVVGILVYLAFILLVAPHVLWKKTLGVDETRRIIVDDDGITIVFGSSTRHEGWEQFSGLKERRGYFALQKRNRDPSTIILKRFFVGPSDEDNLRTLLRAKVTSSNLNRFHDGS
jgi:hypothetical protein